eukprot:jgi/Tetstr1/437769/TSEL_026423.t1
MAGGKKAAGPTKATPADSLAEMPAKPTETTRDTTTLALLQALALKEQLPERLIYSRVFDTAEHERSANVVDGLLAALEDKRLEVGLAAAAKAHASATFKRQAAERDTDRDKARKEKDKAARERRELQRREADAKNRDKNGGRTGDKTRD